MLSNPGRVFEQLYHETFGVGSGNYIERFLQLLHLGSGVGNPCHVGRVGCYIHLECRLKRLHHCGKSLHTLHAAVNHAGACLHPVSRSEYLWQPAVHAPCYALMLDCAQPRQPSSIATGIVEHLSHSLLHLSAKWSEVFPVSEIGI